MGLREDFVGGIDLGKVNDPASIIILRRTPLAAPAVVNEEAEDDPLLLRCVLSSQAPLGTRYHALAEKVVELSLHEHLVGRVQWALDATGVGEAALEIFENEPALDGLLWPVTITAGQKAHQRAGLLRWNVPKKDIKDAVLVNLQRGRLVVCPQDPYCMDTLRAQMYTFRMKVRSGHASYEAEKESDHDDIAIALCLAAWLSNMLPLEEHGSERAGEPGVLLEGPGGTVSRPAPSWRDGPEHRPAGVPPLELF